MQLGFIIDHTRCIGCHACTVACKSENHVPVGSFRTWVKYTEQGEFPTVRRSFSVLRCNQCSAAPCVTICPVNALEKRLSDGIVDVAPDACIGCKSCMQGCPYDALYINEEKGTAEKCHFCAHRTERGLAPACAVVCPTEAIIPGDFDDPESVVSRLRRQHDLKGRKIEAGTGPNVFYREVADAGIDPLLTNNAGGHLWADRRPGPQLDAAEFEALERQATARTTYDVAHPPLWGNKITGYLFTKSLAAGVFLAGAVAALPPFGSEAGHGPAWGGGILPLLALLLLGATSALLVLDLKRPERFLYILTRPNWSSWLVRGTYALIAYGALLSVWAVIGLGRIGGGSPGGVPGALLIGATAIAAGLSACYTAWLFGQAKGRVLWMKRGLWLHLLVQALLAGSAALLPLGLALGFGDTQLATLSNVLLGSLAVHLALTVAEKLFAPPRREAEYHRVVALIVRGPYAKRHWGLGVGAGIALPVLLLLFFTTPALLAAAGVLALVGLFVEEDILVRAGQALSIS